MNISLILIFLVIACLAPSYIAKPNFNTTLPGRYNATT